MAINKKYENQEADVSSERVGDPSRYGCYHQYLTCYGAELFTAVCLPYEGGKFPVVIYRRPYGDDEGEMREEEVCARKISDFSYWLDAGYAVVYQHCRGTGKSGGDCVPYINEREDSLYLRDWIRNQPFYNGELYLFGFSYLSSVHFVSVPFESDIKGAIFEAQDCERYNCNYRNGFYKIGLHGGWYFEMYKKKSLKNKDYATDYYKMLPLSALSQRVLGEKAEDFDEILRHPDRNDAFWSTRFGGGEAHDAIKHARFPILLVTGFYDIYTGGIFDMWRGLDEQTRAMSALAIHPYDHGGVGTSQAIQFENATLKQAFGIYKTKWMDYVRGKGECPFEVGKVNYYKLFDGKWCADEFEQPDEMIRVTLGEGSFTYKYDPTDPATFNGGLCTNFGGAAWQDAPNGRGDKISVYTPEFEEDTFIKGKMRAKLEVSSDCEDTCFYVRISLCKAEGDYGLRDDINQISNFDTEYVQGSELEMSFCFDEHAFVVRKGEKLRIDISSSAFPHYVPHTNQRGLFSEQTSAKIAHNTVLLDRSYIEIPIEKSK